MWFSIKDKPIFYPIIILISVFTIGLAQVKAANEQSEADKKSVQTSGTIVKDVRTIDKRVSKHDTEIASMKKELQDLRGQKDSKGIGWLFLSGTISAILVSIIVIIVEKRKQKKLQKLKQSSTIEIGDQREDSLQDKVLVRLDELQQQLNLLQKDVEKKFDQEKIGELIHEVLQSVLKNREEINKDTLKELVELEVSEWVRSSFVSEIVKPVNKQVDSLQEETHQSSQVIRALAKKLSENEGRIIDQFNHYFSQLSEKIDKCETKISQFEHQISSEVNYSKEATEEAEPVSEKELAVSIDADEQPEKEEVEPLDARDESVTEFNELVSKIELPQAVTEWGDKQCEEIIDNLQSNEIGSIRTKLVPDLIHALSCMIDEGKIEEILTSSKLAEKFNMEVEFEKSGNKRKHSSSIGLEKAISDIEERFDDEQLKSVVKERLRENVQKRAKEYSYAEQSDIILWVVKPTILIDGNHRINGQVILQNEF